MRLPDVRPACAAKVSGRTVVSQDVYTRRGEWAGTGQSQTMAKSAIKPLDIADAFQVVIDLARQNALDADRCDPELREEAQKQHEAIDMVEDLAVNKFGDD